MGNSTAEEALRKVANSLINSQLTKHWQAAVDEFASSGSDAMRNRNVTKELLALGAIRALYWLALGAAEVALAKEIAEWWADCEPLHGLGETIK